MTQNKMEMHDHHQIAKPAIGCHSELAIFLFVGAKSATVLWNSHEEGKTYYVMFKTRAAVFYRDLKPRGAAEWF